MAEKEIELTEDEKEIKQVLDNEFELEGDGKNDKPKKVADDGDPGPDHPRFKQIYAKMKEYERTIEDITEGSAADKAAAKAHNQKLMETIEKLSSNIDKQIEREENKGQTDVVATKEAEIQSLISKRAEARKGHDHDEADRLNDLINDKRDELREVKAVVKAKPKEKEEKKPDEGYEGTDPKLNAAINKFTASHEWFGEGGNERMTRAAIAYDAALENDPEWDKKSYDERFEEVARFVEERFKYNGNGKGKSEPKPKPGAAAVESEHSIGAVVRDGGKTRVTLTEEELRVARMMDMTPEAYARQKALIR